MNMGQIRILFFVERNLHLPFLEPLHDYFQAHHPEIDVAFCAPLYRPSTREKPGCGLDPETMARLAGKSKFVSKPEDHAPSAVVIADINAATYLNNCGQIINVGHGMISKGCFYTSRPIIRRENLADLVCVPGELHKQSLLKNVFVPVEVTGFIKSDKLFGPQAADRKTFLQKHSIDPDKTVILFAPTYNPELSAIPVLQEQILNLPDPESHLVIKLHGMTDQNWSQFYRFEAAQKPNCTFIEDHDLSPCLQAADILISDVSSAFVEFMLLDRPIILVDNPAKSKFTHFDPQDIEYRAREACVVVKNYKELESAVKRESDQPERLSGLRQKYARALCFGRDGLAVQRTARAILSSLETDFPEKFSILVLWENMPDQQELISFWERMAWSTQGFIREVIMVGPRPDNSPLSRLADHWVECPYPDSSSIKKALQRASHAYISIIKSTSILQPGWLKYLYCHLRLNKDAETVQAMTQDSGYQAVVDKFFSAYRDRPLDELAFYFNRFLIGSSLQSTKIDPSCLMFRKNGAGQLLKDARDHQSCQRMFERLEEDIRKKQKKSLRCLDVLAYPCPGSENKTLSRKREKPLAGIVIPVFNNIDLTRNCLQSILKHGSSHPYEIIVVDNGSTDGTRKYLEDLAGRKLITAVFNQKNNGFAKACNQGAREAEADYLVFLNNDTEVTQGWLDALITCIDQDHLRAVAGSKLLYPDDTVQHAGVVFTDEKTVWHIYNGFHKDHPAVNKTRSFQALSAACMLVKQESFFRVGGFDERFINGFEDVDLCLKINRMGYTCCYCPDSVVYHHESRTQGRFDFAGHNEKLLGKLWAGQITADENLYYQQDLIRSEQITSPQGTASFVMHDQNPNPFLDRARNLKNGPNPGRAAALYITALKFNPYDPRNYETVEELADLYLTLGQFDLAEKCLAELIKSAPSAPRYLKLSAIQKKTAICLQPFKP